MATTTISETRNQTEAGGDQCVVLRDVGWDDYETLLRIRGDRSVPRMVYLDGSLLLVSPSFSHERFASRLGRLIDGLTEKLDIPCIPSGRTTFRRRAKKGGVEPDQSYYFVDESPAGGRPDMDLDIDPPPDLAIEVVWTHEADEAVEVHRRLGVSEVWVWEKNRLRILHLDPKGEYAPAEHSLAFPALAASDVESWILKDIERSTTAWAKEFRAWVRRVLIPRTRDEGAGASGQP